MDDQNSAGDGGKDEFWLPSGEVAIVFGKLGIAPRYLLDYVANGLVESSAALVTRNGSSYDFSDARMPPYSLSELWRLWDACSNDARIDSWQAGTFAFKSWNSLGSSTQWEMLGVQFELVTIERSFSGFGAKWASVYGNRYGLDFEVAPVTEDREPRQSETKRRNLGGAPRESEKWEAVTVALVRIAMNGHLDKGTADYIRNQAALRRAVADDPECERLGVNDETIKPFIRKLWYAVIDPDGPIEA